MAFIDLGAFATGAVNRVNEIRDSRGEQAAEIAAEQRKFENDLALYEKKGDIDTRRAQAKKDAEAKKELDKKAKIAGIINRFSNGELPPEEAYTEILLNDGAPSHLKELENIRTKSDPVYGAKKKFEEYEFYKSKGKSEAFATASVFDFEADAVEISKASQETALEEMNFLDDLIIEANQLQGILDENPKLLSAPNMLGEQLAPKAKAADDLVTAVTRFEGNIATGALEASGVGLDDETRSTLNDFKTRSRLYLSRMLPLVTAETTRFTENDVKRTQQAIAILENPETNELKLIQNMAAITQALDTVTDVGTFRMRKLSKRVTHKGMLNNLSDYSRDALTDDAFTRAEKNGVSILKQLENDLISVRDRKLKGEISAEKASEEFQRINALAKEIRNK